LAWIIKYSATATKQLKRVDRAIALRILDYMDNRVAQADDPRTLGRALVGPRLGEYWRYRVGELRIICSIQDEQVCIVVLELGNRREVYR
jgi:mRNA interferase RelE/StbE